MVKFQFRVIPWVENVSDGLLCNDVDIGLQTCTLMKKKAFTASAASRGRSCSFSLTEAYEPQGSVGVNSVSDSPLNPFTLFKLASCEKHHDEQQLTMHPEKDSRNCPVWKENCKRSLLTYLFIYCHLSAAWVGSSGVRRMDQTLFNLSAYYTTSKLSR